MAFMTYDEIVAALRRGRQLGDCVPEDIEKTAREIVARQVPHYHVVIRDSDGTFPDLPARREPIDCECTGWTMVGHSRDEYDPSWLDGSADVYEHHLNCEHHPKAKGKNQDA